MLIGLKLSGNTAKMLRDDSELQIYLLTCAWFFKVVESCKELHKDEG